MVVGEEAASDACSPLSLPPSLASPIAALPPSISLSQGTATFLITARHMVEATAMNKVSTTIMTALYLLPTSPLPGPPCDSLLGAHTMRQ